MVVLTHSFVLVNSEDVVYFDNRVDLRRRELMSLRQDLFVSSAVIDVWSTILNHNEKLRSPDSPCRFFASTDPTVRFNYIVNCIYCIIIKLWLALNVSVLILMFI